MNDNRKHIGEKILIEAREILKRQNRIKESFMLKQSPALFAKLIDLAQVSLKII